MNTNGSVSDGKIILCKLASKKNRFNKVRNYYHALKILCLF